MNYTFDEKEILSTNILYNQHSLTGLWRFKTYINCYFTANEHFNVGARINRSSTSIF